MFSKNNDFGVSIPLNSRYAYCLYLGSSRPAAEPELQSHAYRLHMLLRRLQNTLQKEQWLSFFHQIKLLTGRHVTAFVIVDRALNVLFSDPVFDRIFADMNCVELRDKRLVFLNNPFEQRVLTLMADNGCSSVTVQNAHDCCITAL